MNPAPMAPQRRAPIRASYRLQLNAGFDFAAAQEVAPYLASLGISHLYLSPIWSARPGSDHGYDVVDHTAINPELGGRDGFLRLVKTARDHDLGLILDCVPNHMGISYNNPWWVDVLTWGKTSPFASFFDIDWTPAEPTLRDTVLLPILGDHYGRVLERGELVPGFDGGSLVVRYFEHTLPIFPRDSAEILGAAATGAGDEDAAALLNDLAGLARSIARRRERVSRQRRRADRDRAETLRTRIETARQDPALADRIDAALLAFTPGQGDQRAADRLHRLLDRQAYRLSFWRLAAQEINYRRFFDINDLAGLRMEEPALFNTAHRLILDLVRDGLVDGLRLDHIDGLLDPAQYLSRLEREARRDDGTAPAIFVEKILAVEEALRPDWPVAGTTGYDVMGQIHRAQIDPAGRKPLMALYEAVTGDTTPFSDHCVRSKRLIMTSSLAAELNVLANSLNRLAKQSRLTRDYSLTGLREALINIIAHFDVYRTYIGRGSPSAADREAIARAVRRARRAATTPDLSIYEFLQSVLTTDARADRSPGVTGDRIVTIARKVQQYTGPVTAKSVEDTAFYRWVPLASLNDVGNEPDHFALDVTGFHRCQRHRLERWPASMVTTATHDHKRGEDVRARLAVLSEMPKDWARMVRRWVRLNARKVTALDDGPAPTPKDAYLFYQTLVGIWPLALAPDDETGLQALCERLTGYMEKACRESKQRTSWAVVDPAYENAVRSFIERCLSPRTASVFLGSVAAFVATIAPAGAVNALAQTALRLTLPGFPDTYQGAETWDFSLVDPDNRRPIAYRDLWHSLADFHDRDPADALPVLTRTWRDGRIKQALVARLLAARRAMPEVFATGSYTALAIEGDTGSPDIAFVRAHGDSAVVIAVPRLSGTRILDPTALTVDWAGAFLTPETVLPGVRRGRCLLTGRPVDPRHAVFIADYAHMPPILALSLEK